MAVVQTRSAQSGNTPVTVSITTTAGNLLGIVTGAFSDPTSAASRTGEVNHEAVANFEDVGTDQLRGDYMMNIGGNSNTVTGNGAPLNGTSCCVTEFSGRATTSALGAGVNHAVSATTTVQPGSITPTAASDLMAGTGDDGSTGTTASTINSSFTVSEVGGANTVWDTVAATGGSATLANAAATPVNPTWTSTHSGTTHMTALIMEFLAAGGAVTMPPGLGPVVQMAEPNTTAAMAAAMR